jgi:histone H3/H4
LRLSQEIMSCFNSSLRMSRDAAQALQDSAEAYLTGLFEDSNRCAVHAGRVTVQAKDMNLARVLGKHPDAREGQDFMSTEKVCKGARLGGVTPVRPIQRRRKRQVKGKPPTVEAPATAAVAGEVPATATVAVETSGNTALTGDAAVAAAVAGPAPALAALAAYADDESLTMLQS